MSILLQTALFILAEHKHRPIEGDVLTIGRQTVTLTWEEARDLITSQGILIRPECFPEIDKSTVTSLNLPWITDRSFFSMFTDATVRVLDVSDYEKAEIIHDLNKPLPDSLDRCADFVLDGSAMDDLFDPACAIRCMSRMVRPGGRIMHVEHGTQIGFGSTFICFSPEWFWDFYAINNYSDCQVYVCSFKRLDSTWRVDRWRGLPDAKMRADLDDFLMIVTAEKDDISSDNQTPIRANYREMHDTKLSVYSERFLAYEASSRRYQFDPLPLPAPPRLATRQRIGSLVDKALARFGKRLVKRRLHPLPPPAVNPAIEPAGEIACRFSGKRWEKEKTGG